MGTHAWNAGTVGPLCILFSETMEIKWVDTVTNFYTSRLMKARGCSVGIILPKI